MQRLWQHENGHLGFCCWCCTCGLLMPQCSLHGFLCLSSLSSTMWLWSWSWRPPILVAARRPKPKPRHCPPISLLKPFPSFRLPPRHQSPSPLPRCHVRCRRTARSSQKADVNSTVQDDELAYKISCRHHKRSTEIEDSPSLPLDSPTAVKSRLCRSVHHVKVRVWPRHANQDKDLLIA